MSAHQHRVYPFLVACDHWSVTHSISDGSHDDVNHFVFFFAVLHIVVSLQFCFGIQGMMHRGR
jgi:hypothetical protein